MTSNKTDTSGDSLLRWGVWRGRSISRSAWGRRCSARVSISRAIRSACSRMDPGWVQTANFVLSGLMVLAAAVGSAASSAPNHARSDGPRRLRPRHDHGGDLPGRSIDGFPPGTPKGPPTSISTTGLMHFVAGALTFSCSASAASRRVDHDAPAEPSLALLSLFSGLSVFIGFFGGIASPIGIAGIWFAVVVGWAWLSVLSRPE